MNSSENKDKEEAEASINQPVMRSDFRMAIEGIIANFLTSSEENLEFPSTLSKDERSFIHNYIYKHGLKSRCIGKGKIKATTSD